MYCAKCEFEFKGEGRKECPICGGPLIDFSSLASETPEDQSAENSQETTAESTFDLASLLNDDDKVSDKGPEPEAPPVDELSTEKFETPTFKNTCETPDSSTSKAKESVPFDLESALTGEEEKHSPEPDTEQATEDFFNFETALNEDVVKQSQESEEPAQISSEQEHKPVSEAESEPAIEELSTEELLRRIAEEYKPAEKDSEEESPATAPPPKKPKPVPARSSRSFSAIAALAVFALLAAIASIAYLTPREKLHPTVVNLKTEAEKKINAITDLVIINVEKYLYKQKEPPSSVPQQKTRLYRPVKKPSLAKKASVQEKRVPVGTKPAVANGEVPSESEKTAAKEPTQPQAQTAKEILPQEPPAPQVIEEKEKIPVKPTVTKTSRESLYSLHTGSFIKESIASAEAELLKKMGFNSYVQKASLKNGQIWYRIKVGNFNTRQEAKEIQGKLKQKAPHIKAYVMKKRMPVKANTTGGIAAESKPVAISDSTVSTNREANPPQEDQEIVESQQPIKGAAKKEEKTLPPEINDSSGESQPLAETPQEVWGPIEEVSSPGETFAAEVEQTTPVLINTTEVPLTWVEIPQEVVEPAGETAIPEEIMATEEEIITETGYNPYTQEAEEEFYPEVTVSIETLPEITPEQEDQASITIELLPERGIQKGQEAITPTE
jgi:hypothetical protein